MPKQNANLIEHLQTWKSQNSITLTAYAEAVTQKIFNYFGFVAGIRPISGNSKRSLFSIFLLNNESIEFAKKHFVKKSCSFIIFPTIRLDQRLAKKLKKINFFLKFHKVNQKIKMSISFWNRARVRLHATLSVEINSMLWKIIMFHSSVKHVTAPSKSDLILV